MTNEDKKLVAEYMDWTPLILNNKAQVVIDDVRDVYFDLNDAGLVVKEMVRREEWLTFLNYTDDCHFNDGIEIEFTAWLFNADNFFKAFVEWRKGK